MTLLLLAGISGSFAFGRKSGMERSWLLRKSVAAVSDRQDSETSGRHSIRVVALPTVRTDATWVARAHEVPVAGAAVGGVGILRGSAGTESEASLGGSRADRLLIQRTVHDVVTGVCQNFPSAADCFRYLTTVRSRSSRDTAS